MDEIEFRNEILKRIDTFLESQAQRERKPFLVKIAPRFVAAVVFMSAVFGVYWSFTTLMHNRKDKKLSTEYESLGIAYFEKRDYQRAVAAFREAEKLRPGNAEIQCYLIGTRGFSEANVKEDLSLAEVQCRFVLTDHPLDAEAQNFIGVIYGRNGNFEDAEKAFAKAIELKSGSYDTAKYNLAKAYAEHAKTFGTHMPGELKRRTEYLQKAIAVNKQLLMRNSKDSGALYNSSCDFALLGDDKAAIETLNSALQQGYDRYHVIAGDSDLDGIRQDPGFVQLIKGKSAEVVSKYEDLLETGNYVPQAFHVLAWIGLLSGDRGKIADSIECATRALSEDPGNPVYLSTLAQLHAANGNPRLALATIKMAMNKDPSRVLYSQLEKSWNQKARAH